MKTTKLIALLPMIASAIVAEMRAFSNTLRGLAQPTWDVCNVNEGRHANGVVSRTLDATATRYLVAKYGTDATHVGLAGASDVPLGFILDEGASGDLVEVQLFSGAGTVFVQASAAISAGASVSVTTGGKLLTLPATTGTYYQVGRALNAAASAGDLVEIDPYFCKIVI
jgi:hypothetical protein